MCCYLSVFSLPTCLILSDKHWSQEWVQSGPDVSLDRLPSENDELRKVQRQILSVRSSSGMCFSRRCCCYSAKGKCLQSKCCESCFQSKLFWLPNLTLTPIFGSQKLTNYYCFTQYGTEEEGSVSDSEYKVTQFCLSFSSREHERNSSLHPGSPGYCKYGLRPCPHQGSAHFTCTSTC